MKDSPVNFLLPDSLLENSGKPSALLGGMWTFKAALLPGVHRWRSGAPTSTGLRPDTVCHVLLGAKRAKPLGTA
jgi:hypothetical protein